MYFSRVSLPRHMVRNPYDIHRHLWQFFPDMESLTRDFLFRLEELPHRESRDAATILMLSHKKPIQPDIAGAKLLAWKQFQLNLKEGELLRFAVCANPTKKLVKDKNRVPLVHETEKIDWLTRKLSPVADVMETQIVGSSVLHFRKDNQFGKICTATYVGVIRVKETESLVQMVRTGIGPAKSFGCGLITLARL